MDSLPPYAASPHTAPATQHPPANAAQTISDSTHRQFGQSPEVPDHQVQSEQAADDPSSLPHNHQQRPQLNPPQIPMADPTQDVQENVSPEVATLKGMFPDFDNTVLQSVLDSVNNDQSHAIDILLGMNDPSYVSTAPAHPNPDPSTNLSPNQLELDEQLARQLALEDEEESRRGRRHATGEVWSRQGRGLVNRSGQVVAQGVPPPQAQGQEGGNVPYQTRQNAPQYQGQQTPQGQQGQQQQGGYVTGSERGDFQEFQETVSRIAESGKRTFSSIVSKVKAKINEYDSGKTSQPQQQSSQYQPPSSWSTPGVTSPNTTSPNSNQRNQRTHPANAYYDSSSYPNQPPTSSPPLNTNTSSVSPPGLPSQGGMDRHAVSEYYGQGGQGGVGGLGGWTSTRDVTGYDVAFDDDDSSRDGYEDGLAQPMAVRPYNTTNANTASTLASAASSVGPGGARETATSSTSGGSNSPPPPTRSSGDVPRPPSTLSGSPINAAKLGLLPKRPVSLLPSSSPPPATIPAPSLTTPTQQFQHPPQQQKQSQQHDPFDSSDPHSYPDSDSDSDDLVAIHGQAGVPSKTPPQTQIQIQTQTQTGAQGQGGGRTSDELEYVENPFEEGRK